MIRLALTLVKYGVFALIVLMLGQWLTWDGQTVSDHVRERMAHPILVGAGTRNQAPTRNATPSRNAPTPAALKPRSELRDEVIQEKREPARTAVAPAATRTTKSAALERVEHPERQELQKILKD